MVSTRLFVLVIAGFTGTICAQGLPPDQQEVLLKLPACGNAKSVIEFGDRQHFSGASWESPNGLNDSLSLELYDGKRRVVMKLLVYRRDAGSWMIFVAGDFPLRINIEMCLDDDAINRLSYHKRPVNIQQLTVNRDKVFVGKQFKTWSDALKAIKGDGGSLGETTD